MKYLNFYALLNYMARQLRVVGRAPCWVVWHNVHSQQHTHVSSS